MTNEGPMKFDDFLDQFDDPLRNAIVRLLTKGLLDVPCPICQSTDWVVESRSATGPGRPEQNTPVFTQHTPVFAMKDPRAFAGPAPAIPTAAFTCTSCGFLRQHNVSWLNETGSREPDNG